MVSTLFVISFMIAFTIYSVRMNVVSAKAYEELTEYAFNLMDDNSISLEEKKAIRSQVMFIGMPGMKFLLLLLSPFAGFAIRPLKKPTKKETFKQRDEVDRLYGKALFTSGPVTIVCAILIALFSMFFIYGLVMLAWAVSMFTSSALPSAVSSLQVKAPVTFERMVEYVSHRAFSLS